MVKKENHESIQKNKEECDSWQLGSESARRHLHCTACKLTSTRPGRHKTCSYLTVFEKNRESERFEILREDVANNVVLV